MKTDSIRGFELGVITLAVCVLAQGIREMRTKIYAHNKMVKVSNTDQAFEKRGPYLDT